MSWWNKLANWFGTNGQRDPKDEKEEEDGKEEKGGKEEKSEPSNGKHASSPAQWLPAEATPFGFPVLDLISITGRLISTSESSELAAMSVSWDGKTVADLGTAIAPIESLECELRYPAEEDLPDGWLSTPSCMEEKWVIGHRGPQVLLARSWTGELRVIADARHEGKELVIRRLHLADDSLRTFGDPIQIFDWLLRSHALGQILPLPVNEPAAKLLESNPLAVFSHYGNVAAYAATSWAPLSAHRPLRATSALVTAVRMEETERISELVASGQSLNSRAAVGGYTALHVAAIKGSVTLTKQLLELGADPNVLADRDASVLVTAVVHKGSVELLELLRSRGADVRAVNEDGFGALHALAEVNHPQPLSWLLQQGLDLEQRTKKGHTPLQIAAALGHVEALNALLRAGADASAKSASGASARDIAVAEGKSESVKALDSWQ